MLIQAIKDDKYDGQRLASNQVVVTLGNKIFILQETLNGVIISIPENEYREIEIRPQSKQEIYLSLR